MIPAAFPAVAPAMTVGDLFGPLAPIAAFGVIGGLMVLVALIVTQSWTAARRRRDAAASPSGIPGEARTASPTRPAA
jgi:hypothetical protein